MRAADRALAIAFVAAAVVLVGLPPTGGIAHPVVGATVPPLALPNTDSRTLVLPAPTPSDAPSVPRAFANLTVAPSLLPVGPAASPPPISAVQVTPLPSPPTTVPTVMTFIVNSTNCCIQANFSAPTGGPWAMVVLNYTGQAVNGVYDSSFRAYIDQVQVLFGTTPEYGIWYVSQDVTKYDSLLNGTFNFTFLLSAAVVGGYFLSSVSLSFYPPAPGDVAPTEPNLIVPLFHRVFVSTGTPLVWTVATIPSDAVNATLEMWTYGFGPDEFWYATAQSYRATYVRVDGSPIATVLPFPYINTGGEDLFAWRPITAVFTLSDRPYEFDVTAALGMIEGSHNFSANVSGVTSSSNWLIGGALLLYTDPSVGPATTLSYRSSSPAPRFSSGTSTASPSYAYSSEIPMVGGPRNVSLFTNASFSETITASSGGAWNNLSGRETLSTHEVLANATTRESVDRNVDFTLVMDLGQSVVITSTTGGTYPEFANFTTYFLNGDQDWAETTVRTLEAATGPIIETSSFVEDRLTGGNNVFAGTEELTAPNAALLLSITFIASSTSIDYEEAEFGGVLPVTFSHQLAGASYQPPGPYETESVLVNELRSPLVAVLTATASVLDVGGSFGVSTLAAGGRGPYSFRYSGVPAGCPAPSIARWSCTPDRSGIYGITATVTDASGTQVVPSEVPLFVAALPTVTTSTNTSEIDVGQEAYLVALASGGTGPLSCRWTVNDTAPIVKSCDVGFSFVPSLSGSYSVAVEAYDTLGGNGSARAATIHVADLPGITLVPGADGNGTVGRAVTFTASMVGGTGNASYIWFVNNTVVDGVIGPVLVLAPAGGGRYTVSVEATDSSGVSSFAGPVTWSVHAPASATTAPASSGMDLSTGILFFAAGVGAGAAVVFLAYWRRRPPAPTRRG